MAITATGAMPATILENGRAGDWSATLSLSGLPAGITDIALTGPSAGLFQAHFDSDGRIVITPVGALDREAYAPGPDPLLFFGLTVLADGQWLPVDGAWSVTLLGVDDTPPSGLRFSTGGAVLETDIGGYVGSLLADDPDSPQGDLEYRVEWPDSAEFEIVGTTLKLREGVDLLRQGGTVREVMITVSDGLNEAAFTIGVTIVNVTNQDGPPVSSPPPLLPPPPFAPATFAATTAPATFATPTIPAASFTSAAPTTSRGHHRGDREQHGGCGRWGNGHLRHPSVPHAHGCGLDYADRGRGPPAGAWNGLALRQQDHLHHPARGLGRPTRHRGHGRGQHGA